MYKDLDRFMPKRSKQAAPKGPDALTVALNRNAELQKEVDGLTDLLRAYEEENTALKIDLGAKVDPEGDKSEDENKPAEKKSNKKAAE